MKRKIASRLGRTTSDLRSNVNSTASANRILRRAIRRRIWLLSPEFSLWNISNDVVGTTYAKKDFREWKGSHGGRKKIGGPRLVEIGRTEINLAINRAGRPVENEHRDRSGLIMDYLLAGIMYRPLSRRPRWITWLRLSPVNVSPINAAESDD